MRRLSTRSRSIPTTRLRRRSREEVIAALIANFWGGLETGALNIKLVFAGDERRLKWIRVYMVH
jgi:hypothetical protein